MEIHSLSCRPTSIRMTRFWQSTVFLIAAVIAMAAGADAYPTFKSRAAATAALGDTDAAKRLGAVIYFARNGVARDGPLLVKHLADDNPIVRKAAEEAVWLAWSRSGDAETDRLLNDGTAEMNAGHHRKAIEIFSNVIKRDPEFAEGWNKRATAYYLAGDWQKSLADCDEVMKRNPQHFGALSGYGQIYVQLKQYEKAIAYFRRALAVNPNMTNLEAVIEQLEEIAREQRRHTT
jgi:tetratricopeptide (TPR) repeat protein